MPTRDPTPGRYRDLEAFRSRWRELDAAADCAQRPGPALGSPLVIGRLRMGNRFAIHPMEGWDGTADGRPTDLTRRRWRRFGRSTAKLVWGGEAFAVCAEGRANPAQLGCLGDRDPTGDLAALRAEVLAGHREMGEGTDDLVIGLQLTHSGRHARPAGVPEPRRACRHPILDARADVTGEAVLTDGELERVGERFVRAARYAREAGFDFVDVKCCHGYLLHELLGAHTRPGPYGGSLENRTRLLRRIVAGIRTAVPDLEIGVRISLAEVVPHRGGVDGCGEPCPFDELLPWVWGFGIDRDDPRRFDLDEPLRVLGLLRDLGIRLVNVSAGSPYTCPHLTRPTAYPASDGYRPPRDPLHEVLEHLRLVRRAKASWPDLVFVGSGFSYLQEWLPHVAEHEVATGGADFVGLGRMVLAYPELPHDVLRGLPLARRSLCRTFSDCTTAPRHGLVSGCYPLDPHYRSHGDAARLAAIKAALRRD